MDGMFYENTKHLQWYVHDILSIIVLIWIEGPIALGTTSKVARKILSLIRLR